MSARLLLLTIAALSLVLAGCASVSTDPREGGLAGGIKGLSTGAYDDRVQERESRLDLLRQVQRELNAETDDLEAQKASRTRAVAAERARVRQMDAEVRALNQRVSSLSRSSNASDQRVRTLQQRAPQLQRETQQLQSSLDALEGSGLGDADADLKRAQLERQRDALRAEYETLNSMALEVAR